MLEKSSARWERNIALISIDYLTVARDTYVPIIFNPAILEFCAESVAYVPPETGFVNWLFEKIKKILSATPAGLKEAKEQFESRQKTAEQNFSTYEQKHEFLLGDIQLHIDVVNKVKPLLKDYILKKLSTKLNKIGIKSEVNDYPMEFLDYRCFLIKEEYDVVSNMKNELLAAEYAFYNYYFLVIPYPLYLLRLKTIRKESNALKEKANMILEKMKADIGRMGGLSAALNNIANIFNELAEKFIPLIESFIERIGEQYGYSYKNIPDEELCMIRTCTLIIKEICEKRIVDNSSLEKIKEYSDELSIKYCEIKKIFENAA